MHAVHNYALLERGTELSIRVICEENWAYENDHATIRIRIIAPEVQLVGTTPADYDALMGEVAAQASLKEAHIPKRLTAPKVFGNANKEEEVRVTFRKSSSTLSLRVFYGSLLRDCLCLQASPCGSSPSCRQTSINLLPSTQLWG
jgi:hypothetical protein